MHMMMTANDKIYKIAVLSDSHYRTDLISKLVEKLNEYDVVAHLGDMVDDFKPFIPYLRAQTICIKGNNDFGSLAPESYVMPLCGHKFFITHGHKFGVKSSLSALERQSALNGCDYALFGHTHRAEIVTLNKITAVNPGSLKGSPLNKSSYADVTVSKDGVFAKIILI